MSRLTKLIEDYQQARSNAEKWGNEDSTMVKDYRALCEYLIDYKRLKDLEEQGRLIELPCKVGDTVWLVEKDFPQYPPIEFKFSRKSDIMREMEKCMIFAKTKEEAEKALAELKGMEE